MPTPREFPYIWATWLPRLLVGDRSCEWAVWFKAHYQDFDRQPSDFDATDWQIRHTALLNEQRELWLRRGYEVSVEQQNSFRLRGETAVLAGRADLIARDGKRIDIIDVKTGQPQGWHRAQMMIYMYAVWHDLDLSRGTHLAGEIVYPDKSVKVPPGAVHRGFVNDLGALIRRLASDEPARKIPSAQECRFCEISALECPERVDDEPVRAMTTDDF